MAAVANIYRAAAAVQHHVENSVLRDAELTWTGFVVLRAAVSAAHRLLDLIDSPAERTVNR
jgi:hypothetical protein